MVLVVVEEEDARVESGNERQDLEKNGRGKYEPNVRADGPNGLSLNRVS